MMEKSTFIDDTEVVAWLREVSPYFQSHRGKTFVVYLTKRAIDSESPNNIISDLVILAHVGVRLIVVFDASAQIATRLTEKGITQREVAGFTVSDQATINAVTEVVGSMRLEFESAFSLKSTGGPFAGAASKTASGNFVTAKPAGIVDGVDLGYTGRVRTIDEVAIEARLDAGEIVLLAPIGYSPSGDIFNLRSRELAVAVAVKSNSSKLIFLGSEEGIHGVDGGLIRQLTLHEARELRANPSTQAVESELVDIGIEACNAGIERVHIVGCDVDGAILRELFTRDGVGSMISNAPFDRLRGAVLDDVGGILELVRPLEDKGVLVFRSRETIESEIKHFVVIIREDTVVACGSFHSYPPHTAGEIACIAVHPDYRGGQFGDMLLVELEKRAKKAGIEMVFVLTTQASQWFGERGFEVGSLDALPVEKRRLYNYQRNSMVLIKEI